MLSQIAAFFSGSPGERFAAKFRPRVARVNELAPTLSAKSDAELAAAAGDLRTRRENGESADKLLCEVFALCREAAGRALGMRHFDEQLLGGMALYEGKIAEMKTGEGKTLVATLPVCLEALGGGGAHVVTVNDYLARRDAEWMGKLYRFLGLSVGVNLAGMPPDAKRDAYASDIVYGTNNEFGFDYLRDNMRHAAESRAQGPLNFAIVDEVDSILVDEARTPLIISGEAEDNLDLYRVSDKIAAEFNRCDSPEDGGDFTVDEKTREIHLTEAGFERAENTFAKAGLMSSGVDGPGSGTGAGGSLYDAANLPLMHHLNAALRARSLFLRDRDYVVQDGAVVIVDEFTGRLMPGRRWGEGQHQAVEAKEGLQVQRENRTLASISFQNYFRLYDKLAGMTGTAATEAEEFRFIYGLETIVIPTHREMIRRDELDRVYRSTAAKERAIVSDVRECAARGQPALLGTTSIEASERLSRVLTREKIPHEVLNAKQHEREAHIVAQAGRPGAVTIATNMAGRGTDIVLGGAAPGDDADESERTEWRARHDQVVAAGGLRIIGSERHESRRIDNQLRGRSGRQGDPGASVFYLSFEDSLLRIFETKRVSAIMEKLKIEEDEAIEARMVSRTIENAQRKVEARNFDIRKQLLEYDDIANEQRRMIYEQREAILAAADIGAVAKELRTEHLRGMAESRLPPDTPEEEWRVAELERALASEMRLRTPVGEWIAAEERKPREFFVEKIVDEAERHFAEKTAPIDAERLGGFLRSLVLSVLDDCWRNHLTALDSLRQSIGLRGMAQKNPKQEYKREAFEMFNRMLDEIRATTARVLYALTVRAEESRPLPDAPGSRPRNVRYHHGGEESGASGTGTGTGSPGPDGTGAEGGRDSSGDGSRPSGPQRAAKVGTIRRESPKVRRNDPCPCGSGKKYKKCCGKL